MTDRTEHVRAVAAPIASRHGLEVLSVDVEMGRGAGLVRVIVDAKGGVPLDACQAVSRELSRQLDDDDPIEGRYALEVSSPGIDWPLRHHRDFDRVEDREVDVCYQTDDGAVTQVTGTVLAAEAEAVRLQTKEGERNVAYDAIVWAKQTLPW